MVRLLLMLTRSYRNGDWELHLEAFKQMVPYFMKYDHTHYSKWGPIYIAEMSNLPEPVLSEFMRGNFVVKRSDRRFNEVDADHAQEWLNKVGKTEGGIVGITKTRSALNRWALTYNLRTHIGQEIAHVYNKDVNESHLNDSLPKRKQRDNHDEKKLFEQLTSMEVFAQTELLHNIANKDLVTPGIQLNLMDKLNLKTS